MDFRTILMVSRGLAVWAGFMSLREVYWTAFQKFQGVSKFINRSMSLCEYKLDWYNRVKDSNSYACSCSSSGKTIRLQKIEGVFRGVPGAFQGASVDFRWLQQASKVFRRAWERIQMDIKSFHCVSGSVMRLQRSLRGFLRNSGNKDQDLVMGVSEEFQRNCKVAMWFSKALRTRRVPRGLRQF